MDRYNEQEIDEEDNMMYQNNNNNSPDGLSPKSQNEEEVTEFYDLEYNNNEDEMVSEDNNETEYNNMDGEDWINENNDNNNISTQDNNNETEYNEDGEDWTNENNDNNNISTQDNNNNETEFNTTGDDWTNENNVATDNQEEEGEDQNGAPSSGEEQNKNKLITYSMLLDRIKKRSSVVRRLETTVFELEVRMNELLVKNAGIGSLKIAHVLNKAKEALGDKLKMMENMETGVELNDKIMEIHEKYTQGRINNDNNNGNEENEDE